MSRTVTTQKMGEWDYTFTQLEPKKAVKISLRLFKTIGQPIGEAIGSLQLKEGGVSEKDIKIDTSKLGDAIKELFKSIDEDEALDTIEVLLGSILHGNNPVNFNTPHLQGQTAHIYKLVYKAAEVNFKDFFGEGSAVGSLLAHLKGVVSSRWDQMKSSGPTGDSSSPESQPSKKSSVGGR